MKKTNVRIVTAFLALTFIPKKLKAVIKFFILFITLNAATWIAPPKASAQVSISFQVFYDNLSPYGNWVDNSDYGYVWVPRVSRGFTPYGTQGHWVYTHHGWTWYSNFSWGWAPFHYGRWFRDPYYGWIWVPDNEWGPGWVTWRRSEGYYGWAPIGPGISIDFAYSSGYNLPYDQWRFVRDRDFGRDNIYNYYVSTSNYTTIINNSTVINNIQADNAGNVRYNYNAGPDRVEVERRAGRTFTPVTIKESNKPGQNLNRGELQIYKPQVQKNVSEGRKPAPSKVVGWKEKQPAKIQPVKQQPIKQQPVKEQPVKQQPVKQQPIKQQPVKEQPVKQQPVKQQPIKQQPVKEQPVKQQPVKEQPVKQQPVKQQPIKQQPVKEQPVKQQPVKEQPVKQQPVKEQPVKQQPVKEQPVKQQPVKEQPVKQQPVKPEPKKNVPPKKDNG
jgi:hypothetical protein